MPAGGSHVSAGSWLDYRRHKLTEIQFVIRGAYVELRVLTDSGSNEFVAQLQMPQKLFYIFRTPPFNPTSSE